MVEKVSSKDRSRNVSNNENTGERTLKTKAKSK